MQLNIKRRQNWSNNHLEEGESFNSEFSDSSMISVSSTLFVEDVQQRLVNEESCAIQLGNVPEKNVMSLVR